MQGEGVLNVSFIRCELPRGVGNKIIRKKPEMGEVNEADQDSLAKVGYNAVLCLC